jgi:hypothetical protein
MSGEVKVQGVSEDDLGLLVVQVLEGIAGGEPGEQVHEDGVRKGLDVQIETAGKAEEALS